MSSIDFLIKLNIIIPIVLAKPLNNAQISESFLYKDLDMGKFLFNKPAICVKDQIKLLKSRGLVIADEIFAEEILSNITYYRLSAKTIFKKIFNQNQSASKKLF